MNNPVDYLPAVQVAMVRCPQCALMASAVLNGKAYTLAKSNCSHAVSVQVDSGGRPQIGFATEQD